MYEHVEGGWDGVEQYADQAAEFETACVEGVEVVLPNHFPSAAGEGRRTCGVEGLEVVLEGAGDLVAGCVAARGEELGVDVWEEVVEVVYEGPA